MENLQNVWAVELELLERFMEVCRKYNLQYFADSGTLLGAVRHNGFIPWDDDIDLAMPRKDFNRFRKIAKKEFSTPYFVQHGFSDKGYFGGHIHIRNSNTTAILKTNWPHIKYNQGLFIDVFPLDGDIENKILHKIQDFNKKLFLSILWLKFYRKTVSLNLKHILLFPFTILPQNILFALYELNARFGNILPHKNIDVVAYYGPGAVRNKEWYKEYIEHDFARTKIRVPKEYDKIMTAQYGSDYMTPKQVSSDHGETFFDTKNPYTDYLSGKLQIPYEWGKQCLNQ